MARDIHCHIYNDNSSTEFNGLYQPQQDGQCCILLPSDSPMVHCSKLNWIIVWCPHLCTIKHNMFASDSCLWNHHQRKSEKGQSVCRFILKVPSPHHITATTGAHWRHWSVDQNFWVNRLTFFYPGEGISDTEIFIIWFSSRVPRKVWFYIWYATTSICGNPFTRGWHTAHNSAIAPMWARATAKRILMKPPFRGESLSTWVSILCSYFFPAPLLIYYGNHELRGKGMYSDNTMSSTTSFQHYCRIPWLLKRSEIFLHWVLKDETNEAQDYTESASKETRLLVVNEFGANAAKVQPLVLWRLEVSLDVISLSFGFTGQSKASRPF